MIRNLQKNDIPSVMELLDKCKPYVFAHHEYVYWMQSLYHSKSCFVFMEEDRLIGFLGTLQSIETSSAFIWQISVDPEHRKKGIAFELLCELEKLLRDGTIQNIQLSITDGNSTSLNLFQGFAEKRRLSFLKIDSLKIAGSRENVYNIEV